MADAPSAERFRLMDRLDGKLAHITFHNPANGYTVARVTETGTGKPVTVVGHLPGFTTGAQVSLEGNWQTHPRFGPQFAVVHGTAHVPSSTDEIRNYLTAGHAPGIGPTLGTRLFECFGDRVLDIIATDPNQLLEVSGVGPKTVERIAEAWKAQQGLRALQDFLHDHEVPLTYSAVLFELYGDSAATILAEDPYCLASDLPGKGFQIADALARSMGTADDDPHRVAACLCHLLDTQADQGHTEMPVHQAVALASEQFGIDPMSAESQLLDLSRDGTLVWETWIEDDGQEAQSITGIDLFKAENGLATRLAAMLSRPIRPTVMDVDAAVDTVVRRLAIALSEEQAQVLTRLLAHPVAILTGGPGTGKTTLVRAITAVWDSLGRRMRLAAPTGRAARRLAEVTGRDAATIHRLIGFNPMEGYCHHHRDHPIDADTVIVDEAAMVDTVLMHRLLDAVPLSADLILVGDVHQLPPVGPGNVLADLIRSAQIPTLELTTVFRQAEESAIVANAHRVRSGAMPIWIAPAESTGDPLPEFTLLEHHQPEPCMAAILNLCQTVLPEQLGLDPIRDVQVITPMHRGKAGTIHLNQVLQDALNPVDPSRPAPTGIPFRLGDKVMHQKNNYGKDVFNGDIGRVSAIDAQNNELTVDFDGRAVVYERPEWTELTLAYAITVHKSQGSEYPAVVLALLSQHRPLLQRNLLYTAMTRGERQVVIVGSPRAMATALANNRPAQRRTRLVERLTGAGATGRRCA